MANIDSVSAMTFLYGSDLKETTNSKRKERIAEICIERAEIAMAKKACTNLNKTLESLCIDDKEKVAIVNEFKKNLLNSISEDAQVNFDFLITF